jgi:myo-inositol-1(or 4)-monophosphatase
VTTRSPAASSPSAVSSAPAVPSADQPSGRTPDPVAAGCEELLVRIAREGAAIAARSFRTRGVTARLASKKTGYEIVTEVDLEVETFVRERLERALEGVTVIGEERGESRGARSTSGVDYGEAEPLRAFVDPIDGTTNYAHGHPFWCTSIGLWRGTRPLAAAVVAPALGLVWSAHVGGPALRNEEIVAVTNTNTLAEAMLATGFPYDRRTSADDNLLAFAYLKKRVQGLRRCGSAAIDLCLVADGTYDGYWERKLMPWDAAAGVIIAQAAGAHVTTDAGAPFVLWPARAADSTSNLSITRIHVLAANPSLHPVLLGALTEAGASPVASAR